MTKSKSTTIKDKSTKLNSVKKVSIWQRLMRSRRVKILVSLLVVIVIINAGIAGFWYQRQKNKPWEFGVSFSTKMARELGIDPRNALEGLLGDLDLNYVRLMSYWDEHEKSQGQYDFSELDWQFELARQYEAKVSLAIGLRQPRWPECHQPEWANSLGYEEWRQAIKDYTGQVIDRYKDHPSLESYQLENEFFITTFGTCTDYNRDRFEDEHAFVLERDPDHDVVINLSNNWLGWPVRGPQPESTFGISIYKKVWDDRITGDYLEYPLPGWYYAHRAGWINLFTGKDLIAHEFQAEPWGPVATVKLSSEEQNITMNPNIFHNRINYIKQTGIRRVYLWGGEWWYWRKQMHNDYGMWSAVKSEVAKHNYGIANGD